MNHGHNQRQVLNKLQPMLNLSAASSAASQKLQGSLQTALRHTTAEASACAAHCVVIVVMRWSWFMLCSLGSALLLLLLLLLKTPALLWGKGRSALQHRCTSACTMRTAFLKHTHPRVT